MPRGDRTGPGGMGPMTGRAGGYCAGFGMPGSANFFSGRSAGMGFGRGRGGGRGRRNMFYATGQPGWMRFGGYSAPEGYPVMPPNRDPEMEKAALRNQAAAMQSELDMIRKRLAEIDTASTAE